jgi:hypothetical protein
LSTNQALGQPLRLKIVQAVIHGRQPIGLTTKALLNLDPLPLLWTEQEALLGV